MKVYALTEEQDAITELLCVCATPERAKPEAETLAEETLTDWQGSDYISGIGAQAPSSEAIYTITEMELLP